MLLKPGRLDAREWALMKTHAELGGRAIDEVVGSLERPGFLVVDAPVGREAPVQQLLDVA